MESLELTLATLSPCTILRIKTDEIDKERLAIAIENIQTKESATWWIDNRDIDVRYLLKNEYERAEKPLLPKEKEFKAEALAEATIRPESPKTETIAEIRILQNAVEVIFPEKGMISGRSLRNNCILSGQAPPGNALSRQTMELLLTGPSWS